MRENKGMRARMGLGMRTGKYIKKKKNPREPRIVCTAV